MVLKSRKVLYVEGRRGVICRKSAGDIECCADHEHNSREVERVDSLLPGLRQTGRHLVEWCVGDKTDLKIGR